MTKTFDYIMDIGEQMLLSGAEVHRVEESIERMCNAFGVKRVDVFIITSSMVVTVHTNDGQNYTQTRRVTSTGTDFEKLHHLNNLSREICQKHLDAKTIKQKLDSIENSKKLPLWMEFLCYAVIAGAFAIFFGGNLTEAVVAFGVGALMRLGGLVSEKIISNKIFNKFFCSVVATFLAFVSVNFGWIPSVDNVIIGNIMTLIPGIGFTNAIRDLFVGDSIAGLLRSIEAVLTALAIAAGYFLVALLGGFAV